MAQSCQANNIGWLVCPVKDAYDAHPWWIALATTIVIVMLIFLINLAVTIRNKRKTSKT